MRRAIVIAVVALSVLVSSARAVSAQERQPTAAEMDQARNYFKRAEASKDLKEYDDAVAEYLKAYALYPEPEFFFNIGEVYRLKGDPVLAIEYFNKYLAAAPRGRVAAAARQSIRELGPAAVERRKAAAEESERKAAAAEADRKAAADADRKVAAEESERKAAAEADRKAGEEAERKAAEEVTRAKAPAPRDGGGRPGRTLALAGLGSAAAGVLMVAVGVKFGLDASSLSDDVSNVGDDPGDQWSADNLDKISQGESADSKMMLFTGIGAAAIVAGGAMYFVGKRKGSRGARADKLTVVPATTSSWTGIALMGRF